MAKVLATPEYSQMYLTSKSLDEAELTTKEQWYKIDFASNKYSEQFLHDL